MNKTITIDGIQYNTDPEMSEFLQDAGIKKQHIPRVTAMLENAGIDHPEIFHMKRKAELEEIDGINTATAKALVEHAGRLRRKSSILVSVDQLELLEQNYQYLRLPSASLNSMLTHSNGKMGIRSGSLVEMYGEPAVGKTQLCMTAAAMCMRPRSRGGWGKGVIYIDTEGSFDLTRMHYMARYWEIDEQYWRKHMMISKVSNFDDVQFAIEEVAKVVQKKDIGMIIVDSIMDPLKSQYPVGGEDMSNLQPRQKHLKQVLDLLKSIAQRHNIICLYTNQVRVSFEDDGLVAQGGSVMGHASDIRIELTHLSKAESTELDSKAELEEQKIRICRAKIVDSGFLPTNTGIYLMGPMGLVDLEDRDTILKHTRKINKDGFISISSSGKPLEPLHAIHLHKEEELAEIKSMLFGKGKSEAKAKT